MSRRYLLRNIQLFRRPSDLANTGNIYGLRLFSVGSECDEQQSFTVSYLMNSIGLTKKAAKSASMHVKFSSPEKPDKTVEILRNFGFSPNQITQLVGSLPNVLAMSSDQILPKLEFLVSKGISRPEIATRLCIYPKVLSCGLDDRIMPSYDYLRKLLGSDVKTIVAVKKCLDILTYDTEKTFEPNIAALREHRIPAVNLAAFTKVLPRALYTYPARFRMGVKKVLRMGFDPSHLRFIVSLSAVLQENWESKVSLFKKFGWSYNVFSEAFLRSPWFMLLSEEKITTCMNFYCTEMDLRPRDVAKIPKIFKHDLNTRVIPRVLYYKALLSKPLVKNQVSFLSLMTYSDKEFREKFVMRYATKDPELLKLYDEKIRLSSKLANGRASK